MKMQQVVVLLAMICFVVVQGAAQSPCPDKVLTTNTTASVNAEKPAMKNYDPTRTHPMIFDWTQVDFALQSNEPGLINRGLITSPFFQIDNSNTIHLAVARDMHSKDGWELIRQDFGYEYQPYLPIDPDGLKRTGLLGIPKPVGNPFFILYNKYTGILRVFVAIGRFEPYSAARIQIFQVKETENDLQTSPLYESSDIKPLAALDDFSPAKLIAISPFINEEARWLYADFPMAYDPCTCLYTSSLQIEVQLIEEAHIELVGETKGTLVTIDEKDKELNTDNNSMAFGLTDLANVGKKVAESYKNAGDFASKAWQTINDAKRKEAEDKLELDLSDVVTEQDWQDLYNSLSPEEQVELATLSAKYKTKKEATDGLKEFLQSLDFLEAPLKVLPFMASAMDVIDFFTGGGKKEPAKPQKVEVQPMSINMTTTLKGTITAEHLYKTITLFTPGAKDNATRQPEGSYPIYNQTLGTFNLLRTPKVKEYYETENTAHVEFYASGPVCAGKNTATRYYQLEDDIQYVVNPAAGFDMDNIEVLGSLVFEFDYDIEKELRQYEHPMLVLDSYQRYRTRYVPAGCLKDLFAQFLYRETTCQPLLNWPYFVPDAPPTSRAPKVFLKLMVRLQRADADENTQGVLFVGTYPVEITKESTFKAKEWTTHSDYDDVPEYILVPVTPYTPISGEVNAWRIIFFFSGSDISTHSSAGSSITRTVVTAGEQIGLGPGARVYEYSSGKSTTLRIGMPHRVCTSTLKPIDAAVVENFCRSSTYRDSRRFPKEAVTGEPLPIPTNGAVAQLLGISPNPSQGEVAIRYTTQGEQAVRISIVNPLGIEVGIAATPMVGSTGEHVTTFNGSSLARGMYYCVLECNGHKVVGKFVLY